MGTRDVVGEGGFPNGRCCWKGATKWEGRPKAGRRGYEGLVVRIGSHGSGRGRRLAPPLREEMFGPTHGR